jgi:ParB family transcriptional regulator, chromosome partitioning protein
MTSIVSANPFQCRMWELHDRLEAFVTEQSCKLEIESFAKHGQLIPVLARPLPANNAHKFELIYGARRLFVARHLNAPLLLEVREMSDRQALIAMDLENRQRMDLSPYERGLSYSNRRRISRTHCESPSRRCHDC